MASSSPYLLYPDGSAVKILAASSMLFGKTHVSEEVVGLEELFTKDSFEYDNFSIKILNQFPGAQEYLHKALMGIVVVPIRDKSADNDVIGAIVLCDVLNNDNYFAERYSRNLDNSFLAFSIDGIRIASNIQTDTKSNFVGSRAPHETGKYVTSKQLKVKLKFEPDDFMIEADAAKLKQILYNLLSNAVKFTGTGGQIEIYVYKREDVAEFIVRDNGIGIAEQDQKKVFVEFEQVDSSYTREYEGTGLGLPLVKKMVEMHGGYVYLKSALGEGTEVIFLIPLQQGMKKQ